MMDVAMEQLHQDMAKVREEQAAQRQMLSQIMQQLGQSTQATTQMSMQMGQLVTEVAVLKHETQRHQSQIDDLEKDLQHIDDKFTNALKENSKDSTNFGQWLMSQGLTILIFLLTCIVTFYSVFLHH